MKSSKKVENPRDCLSKIRDNLARGKSAKLFLVSLSQQITAGGPEALLYFVGTITKSVIYSYYLREHF